MTIYGIKASTYCAARRISTSVILGKGQRSIHHGVNHATNTHRRPFRRDRLQSMDDNPPSSDKRTTRRLRLFSTQPVGC